MMEINKHSTTPLYAQVRSLILDRIAEGDYKPGSRIPSEMKLCQDLGLSRPTVRQAIQGLVDSGFLVIRKGRGTFVVKEPEPTVIYDFNPGNFSILAKNEYSHDEFDKARIIETSANLDKIFNFTPELYHRGYWMISFVVPGEDDDIIGLGTSYIPVRYFEDLQNQLENDVPMLKIKAGKGEFLPVSSQMYLGTRPCTPSEASTLDIPDRTNVMFVQAILQSKGHFPCEYLTMVFLSEKVQLQITPPAIKSEVPQNL